MNSYDRQCSEVREFIVTLFVSHIRPIIDYCWCVWNVRVLKSLQKRWTREVVDMGRFQYNEHLELLEIYSVHGSLHRADLVNICISFNSLSLVRVWRGSLWLGSREVWMRACGTSCFIWWIYIYQATATAFANPQLTKKASASKVL